MANLHTLSPTGIYYPAVFTSTVANIISFQEKVRQLTASNSAVFTPSFILRILLRDLGQPLLSVCPGRQRSTVVHISLNTLHPVLIHISPLRPKLSPALLLGQILSVIFPNSWANPPPSPEQLASTKTTRKYELHIQFWEHENTGGNTQIFLFTTFLWMK